MDWTEKYRPQSLDGVLGNPTAVNTMRAWARAWEAGIPEKRALVLMGPPGVGKTTSAEALAREFGWGVVEMNASDQRKAADIEDIAIRGSLFNTFSDDGRYMDAGKGERKLIILDEADSMSGTNDRGGMAAINKLIRETLQPVVIIVNDWYATSRKSSTIKNDTLQINFKRPQASTISKALYRIAESEGVDVEPAAMEIIVSNADGDMRAAVRNLESLSLGESEVTLEMAEGLSNRSERNDMYDLMSAIFRKKDAMGARRLASTVDADPGTLELWVDENLPYEFQDKGDLVRGYERLCRADVFLGRVHRRQYFGFWRYATDTMTSGIAISSFSNRTSHDRIKFPTYLTKMSRSKSVRAMRASVVSKLSMGLHMSSRLVEADVLPYARAMATDDPSFRMVLADSYGLEPEELAFLMGKKSDSKDIKAVYSELESAAEARRQEAIAKREAERAERASHEVVPVAVAEAPVEHQSIENAPKAEKPKGQRSLFDF